MTPESTTGPAQQTEFLLSGAVSTLINMKHGEGKTQNSRLQPLDTMF